MLEVVDLKKKRNPEKGASASLCNPHPRTDDAFPNPVFCLRSRSVLLTAAVVGLALIVVLMVVVCVLLTSIKCRRKKKKSRLAGKTLNETSKLKKSKLFLLKVFNFLCFYKILWQAVMYHLTSLTFLLKEKTWTVNIKWNPKEVWIKSRNDCYKHNYSNFFVAMKSSKMSYKCFLPKIYYFVIERFLQ